MTRPEEMKTCVTLFSNEAARPLADIAATVQMPQDGLRMLADCRIAVREQPLKRAAVREQRAAHAQEARDLILRHLRAGLGEYFAEMLPSPRPGAPQLRRIGGRATG